MPEISRRAALQGYGDYTEEKYNNPDVPIEDLLEKFRNWNG